MPDRRRRVFVALCLLAVAWIAVYWLRDPTGSDVHSAIRTPTATPPRNAALSVPKATPPDPPRVIAQSDPPGGVIAPQFETYTIAEQSETWASISQAVFGTTAHASAIADANPYVVNLTPGREVRIPLDPDNVRGRPFGEAAAPDRPAVPNGVIKHTVRAGDVLSGISRRYYGSSRHWQMLFEHNRERLGLKSPESLRVGQVVLVPPLDEAEDNQ